MKENWVYANSVEEYRFYEKTAYTFANKDELVLELQFDFDLRTASLTTKHYKGNTYDEENAFSVPLTWEEALSELQTSIDPEECRELLEMYEEREERRKLQALKYDLPAFIVAVKHLLDEQDVKKDGSFYNIVRQLLPRVSRLITTSEPPDQNP